MKSVPRRGPGRTHASWDRAKRNGIVRSGAAAAPGRPPQSPKRMAKSRAVSMVSLSSGTVFMRLIAALSGS